MVDLNVFIAKCSKLVKDDAKKRHKSAQNLGLIKKAREFLADAWAAYRFTMKDKQPFRDKLVLPAQSINIFLTSLTHVSLNRLMKPPAASAASTASTGKPIGVVDDWDAVGGRVAFTHAGISQNNLTIPGLEDKVIAYAIHLINGGNTFPSNSAGKTKSTGGTSKVPKPRRKSSVSPKRANYRMRDSQNYLVRPVRHGRSRSRLRADSIEIVEPDDDSGAESEPSVYLIEPPPDSSSSRSYARRERLVAEDPPPRNDPEDQPDTNRASERQASQGRRTLTPQEVERHRRAVRQAIQREQELAVMEMEIEEQKERQSRPERYQSRPEGDGITSGLQSPPRRYQSRPERRQRYDDEHDDEPDEEAMEVLAREYGLFVEPIGDARPPIDHGPVPASEGEEDLRASDREYEPRLNLRRRDNLRAETTLPTVYPEFERERFEDRSRQRFEPRWREGYGPRHWEDGRSPERRYERGPHMFSGERPRSAYDAERVNPTDDEIREYRRDVNFMHPEPPRPMYDGTREFRNNINIIPPEPLRSTYDGTREFRNNINIIPPEPPRSTYNEEEDHGDDSSIIVRRELRRSRNSEEGNLRPIHHPRRPSYSGRDEHEPPIIRIQTHPDTQHPRRPRRRASMDSDDDEHAPITRGP